MLIPAENVALVGMALSSIVERVAAEDEKEDAIPTRGGYSNKIVVDENYVFSIPDNLPLDSAAPLLCAGITLYSPLMHWKAGPGK